jgi:hypothetical protein
LAISQLLIVHDPCVVASTLESFLRRDFYLSLAMPDPGVKNPALGSTHYPCANFVKNSSTQLNRYKKLLRWKNFATHPFTALMSSGYFLPDFMKVVLIERSNYA